MFVNVWIQMTMFWLSVDVALSLHVHNSSMDLLCIVWRPRRPYYIELSQSKGKSLQMCKISLTGIGVWSESFNYACCIFIVSTCQL